MNKPIKVLKQTYIKLFHKTYSSFIIEMFLWSVALIIVSFYIHLDVMQLHIFGIAAYTIVLVLSYKRFTLFEMGFRKNMSKTFLPWTIVSFTMIIVILGIKSYYPSGLFIGFSKSYESLLQQMPFYILFSAVLQEFIFRGYFFQRAKQYFSLTSTVVINIIIFSAFHLPYIVQLHSPLFYLSIGAGAIWTILYAKYPNIILAAASHSTVGAIALLMLQKF